MAFSIALTDEWRELRDALRNVPGLGRAGSTPEEIADVQAAIASIDIAMNRDSGGSGPA